MFKDLSKFFIRFSIGFLLSYDAVALNSAEDYTKNHSNFVKTNSNYRNFVVTKAGLRNGWERYEYGKSLYDWDVFAKMSWDMEYLVIFAGIRYGTGNEPGYKLLTKAGGHSFDHALDKLDSADFEQRKRDYLRKSVRKGLGQPRSQDKCIGFFQFYGTDAGKEFTNAMEDYVQHIEETILYCDSLGDRVKGARELKKILLDYKFNTCSYGMNPELDVDQACRILEFLESAGQRATLTVVPLTDAELVAESKRTHTLIQSLRGIDGKSEVFVFGDGSADNSSRGLRLVYNGGRYSRLLDKTDLADMKIWAKNNNVGICEINLDATPPVLRLCK
ncbi:MAG: hypothetical protein LBJ16_02130 [Holosporaceae bacterium]|nr:hypothetical protein [Holosporaceae bacterium]